MTLGTLATIKGAHDLLELDTECPLSLKRETLWASSPKFAVYEKLGILLLVCLRREYPMSERITLDLSIISSQ